MKPIKMGPSERNFIMAVGDRKKTHLSEIAHSQKEFKSFDYISKKMENIGLTKSKKKGRKRMISLTKQGLYYYDFYRRMK